MKHRLLTSVVAVVLALFMGASAAAQSGNNSRYYQFADTAAASVSSPASGRVRLFFDSTGFYWKNSAGVSTAVGGGGFTLTQYNIPMAATTTTLGDSMMVASGTYRGTWTLFDSTATNGVSKFVIQAGQGQSTTVLQNWSNFAGTPLSAVSAGGLFLAPNGTKTAPAFSFLGDTDNGLYLVGANSPAMSAGDTLIQSWTTTGTTVVGTMAATTVTGAGTISGLSANAIPYATGANALADGPLYRAAAARIGLGGVTDSEPGFRWSGTTIDFVTAGAGAFIRVNALEYQLANTTMIKTAGGDGNLAVRDSVDGLGFIVAGRRVVPVASSPRNVTTAESNYTFTNEGAAGAMTFNLPTPVAGLVYTFICQDADDLIIDADATSTIRDGATVSGTDDTATITDIGSVVTIIAINTTEWIIVYSKGTVTLSV